MAASVAQNNGNLGLNQDARLWSVYRGIYNCVDAAIYKREPDAVHDLDAILRKHRPDFLSLLKNPAKDVSNREEIKKASTVGISIAGQPSKQTLTKEFIDEALIISDLFDINEFAAVEFLLAGEYQLPHFPGMTRGLVAILLYYDGKRCLVNSLRTLIQARVGRTWTLGLSSELTNLATRFTDQLIEDGLPDQIFALLSEFNLLSEIDKLQKQRGLGKAKHKKLVTDQINEIRMSLAECVFNLACQSGLSSDNTIRLFKHLSEKVELAGNGSLDNVGICLVMAALFAIDVSIVEQEDGEELVQKLYVMKEARYADVVHQDLMSTRPWACGGIRSTLRFAWAQTLRTLAQHAMTEGLSDLCEQDENVVESAVEDGVFRFIRDSILPNEIFFTEEFYVRRVHGMITDFLVQMPLKVKELRNRGDEVARIIIAHTQEGLQSPVDLPHDFEHLMSLMGELYKRDDLQLELALEYWCPTEYNSSPGFSARVTARPPQRQISLYKFVRSAGDLLPPSLYIPYITMLSGLANGPECAHHCYNLLKTNGTNYSTQASTVSFDHFFDSLNRYLNGLRQDMPPSTDRVYRYSQHRGITPQELDGLVSVLRLIRTIVSKEKNARVAMYDNQQWMVIYLFFGLLACSVPSALKAELLLTLAAFTKTPEISNNLWQSLENSQILPTISNNSLPPSGGIRVELDEVEARNEEYSMTLAFMTMLEALTDGPAPLMLGAGTRAPGLDPYIDFVRDSIFLKFTTRAYKNVDEKWKIAAKSVSIFHKLLRQYEPQVDDCLDPSQTLNDATSRDARGVVRQKPPGYTLMVHLLNDSRLLRMILFIVDDTIDQLDQYPSQQQTKSDSQICASLYCLKIVAEVLDKQQQFLTIVRESGSSLLVSPVEKLLFGINPRSSKADHHVNIARYVSHGQTYPEHALAAVHIMSSVSQTAQSHGELVSLITANQRVCANILHGFVECLEVDEPEPNEEQPNFLQDVEDIRQSEVRANCRLAILSLLVDVCDQQAPNLAHFLLGFNVQKPISTSNLQDPGVAGSPRTCLHAVLTILNRGLNSPTGPHASRLTPRLAEKAYHLISKLCDNRETSGPTMRYLRTAYDYFYSHVQCLPFARGPDDVTVHVVRQQAWLLHTVAVELRMTSLNRQRSHTQRLMTSLIDDQLNAQAIRGLPDRSMTSFDIEQTLGARRNINMMTGGGQIRSKLLCVLDLLKVTEEDLQPDLPLLDFLDAQAVEQILAQCEEMVMGKRMYDVRYLHQILFRELNSMQAPTLATQRMQIQEEMKAVLTLAVQRNAVRDRLWAKRTLFDTWRQVVEIILAACPLELLDGDSRQEFIFELLQDILVKVSDDHWLADLTSSAANVLLTLLSNLRQCFLGDQPSNETTRTTSLQFAGVRQVARSSRTLYLSSLQVVLRGLVEFILRTSGGQQGVRANLYGAMLYCIQIAQKPNQMSTLDIAGVSSSPVKRSSTGTSLLGDCEYDKLRDEYVSSVSGYGEQLMDVVCRDACDGHEVVRMLALSCLDTILSLDRTSGWLSHLQSKGYLQHLVDSLKHDDPHLQAMLKPNPEPLRSLYLYESKLGLLTRIASNVQGAQGLLRCGVMARLSECAFLDMRPERVAAGAARLEMGGGFVPSVFDRYRQLLFPALKLSLAVMTSLGIENKDAANHVLKFVASHGDVFHSILRDQQARPELCRLEELALVTAVVSRAAVDGGEALLLDNMADVETHSQFSRIQRQLMALLPRFANPERFLDQMQVASADESESSDTKRKRREMKLAIVTIVANVMAYCRTLVTSSGMSSKQCRILFGPSFNEVVNRDLHGFNDSGGISLTDGTRPVSLGIVVLYLRQFADLFASSVDKYKITSQKYQSINDLSADELRELSGIAATEKVSTQHRQKLAKKSLVLLIEHHVKEIKQSFYLIEHCLFILWRHLEFYFLHCPTTEQNQSLFRVHADQQTRMRRLQDLSSAGHSDSMDNSYLDQSRAESSPSWIGKDEIDKLKLDSLSAISDTLLKKLGDIEQCYAQNHTHYGFMAALIRRLKRLLRLHTAVN